MKIFSRISLALGIFICFFSKASCQNAFREDADLLVKLMISQPDKFRQILLEPEVYEVQIIYTQILRDSANIPFLKEYTYRLNPKTYFNCASLVKLPVAALSLEKLNEMNLAGVNKFTRMGTEASFACQTPVIANNPKDKNYPCIARYIEKTMLVSDNDAYTRLYEFLGQDYIRQKFKAKSYSDARIVRRYSIPDCDVLQNRYTNPITFYDDNCKVIYKQAAQFNANPAPPPLGTIKKGKAYVDVFGRMVNQAMDFTNDNFLSLRDIHDILLSLIFPEKASPERRFNLNQEDYQLLIKALGSYPQEGMLNTYQLKDGFFDSYKKYLYYGRAEKINPSLRIFNVVGWWAGYISDSAYFADFENQIEFFLSAVIYTNRNQIFDHNMEYSSIGFPFLANIGKLVYNYEKSLIKPFPPDLSRFKF